MLSNRQILLLFLSWLSPIAFAQEFAEYVDGDIISSNHSFYNASIDKKESAINDYISIYQKYISGVRGQHCPMYPSCSNYGLKVFTDKNFISAMAMTSDRLLRCGHDHDNYSLSLRDNGFRYVDYPPYDQPPKDLIYHRNEYFFAYSDVIKDDSTKLFIKDLINNQFFTEALLEIRRIEFYEGSFDLELFINKIICLKALEEYEKAIFEYETKCPEEYKINEYLLYQIALIEYELGNYVKALELCEKAELENENSYLESQLLLLNGFLYSNLYEWEKAKIFYKKGSPIQSYNKVFEANQRIVESAILIKPKNPKVAGLLSIVPGVGYAYTGHNQTAISSFLINGLLAYATYSSIRSENYGVAILTGIFNITFSIGNIYGASKSAVRYNDQQKLTIIDKLKFNTNF